MIINNGAKTKTIHFKKTLRLINNGQINIIMSKNAHVVLSPNMHNNGSVIYDKNDKRISVREPHTFRHPLVINNGQLTLNIQHTVGIKIMGSNGQVVIK